ncbi:MAG TPA: secretin N-terminal domain-containing protein [Thermoanaerobaculia bacterium]|nr:secretin N-terminal domain-containing protein [Thermoanaerobaculia bacterium]
MNRLKKLTALTAITLVLSSCMSFNAYKQARTAEIEKNWDVAVAHYEKALEINPTNRQYKIALDRARREASREHFEKGRTLRAAASEARGSEQFRLAQLAATELEVTIKLDPSNQFAAVELSKAIQLLNDIQRAASEKTSVDEVKKRAQSSITKAQPPQLNPASNEPISLTFSRDTPVKDIYRALGNAFGINILFDQAVKDDRITIDLRDVTAQAALERVMQAANHFYKVLDEKTIIVVPDNPQARRDYEDLVIQTFYLSNGDAEQVTNVVRTMIEARNVFPLKALNAITIRDTADKVRIAEKIIQANDKAKAEVVVTVELVQLDLTKLRDMGLAVSMATSPVGVTQIDFNTGKPALADGKTAAFAGGTISDITRTLGSSSLNFTLPTASYSLLKTLGNSELLANPELRISEGEKATLHIGQRIPVPVTTLSGVAPGGSTQPGGQVYAPYTSFQYQDVGIKVAMEPRVHHNREVTLKLTVEVSNQGQPVTFAGQSQPTFATRTIESTIRLKDGETNFLAGLIQSTRTEGQEKTPFLGDIPFIGRLFTKQRNEETRTDLVLTMTPHIIRIPDITEEDVSPMWVGTGTNLTFRGVSPRIESQGSNGDPFSARTEQELNAARQGLQLAPDGEPGNYIQPEPAPPKGSSPNDPFKPPPQPNPNQPPPEPEASLHDAGTGFSPSNVGAGFSPSKPETGELKLAATSSLSDAAMLRLAPRLAPQPASIALGPGESKIWNVVGMDLDGLSAPELHFRFDPRAMDVMDVAFGAALVVDPAAPPSIVIDRSAGTIRVKPSNGKPLQFVSGGVVLAMRVLGGMIGETYLVIENPELRNSEGQSVMAAIAGGRAKVQ